MYKTRNLPNTRIDVADALRGIAVADIILYHSVEHFNIFTQEPIAPPLALRDGIVVETLAEPARTLYLVCHHPFFLFGRKGTATLSQPSRKVMNHCQTPVLGFWIRKLTV